MITIVVKEGSVLRIVESSDPIPEGTRLILQPQLEVSCLEALELAQLESLGREQEEDWGKILDPLTLPPGQMPSVTAAR
ncbi:MAG: hypothetical protein WCQ21_37420 [Verrucomicrobiota bacterium]